MPRPAVKRLEILDAARELFAARGFHDVTLKEVAEKAGASQGLVIHHFTRLEDLYNVVIEEIRPLTADVLLPQLIENPEANEKLLRKFLLDYIDYRVENEDRLKLLDWARLGGDTSRSETEIEFLNTLADWIKGGQTSGKFRNDIGPNDVILIIAATVKSWIQSGSSYGEGILAGSSDNKSKFGIEERARVADLLYTLLFEPR